MAGALLTVVLASRAVTGAAAERGKRHGRRGEDHRGSHQIAAEKKRRKKRKSPSCSPRCSGRICGPDGCGGSCGACPGPTGCNADGQCVGCAAPADCPVLACREASCDAAICRYADLPDASGCGSGRICCSGACIDPRTDDVHCGSCGTTCAATQACYGGRCLTVCDVCASGCKYATIQAAIDDVTGGDTIRLCVGEYPERATFTRSMTLLGLGGDPAAVVIRNAAGPVLTINNGKTVTLRNLTITGGRSSNPAGGISNFGMLTLDTVHVVDNGSTSLGGGIFTFPATTLRLFDSVIRDNSGGGGGGGIFNSQGQVFLTRSRIEGNDAAGGGGIYNASGQVTLSDNSVISGNTCPFANSGAGIFNEGGTVTLNGGSRVTDNDPDNCAGTDCS